MERKRERKREEKGIHECLERVRKVLLFGVEEEKRGNGGERFLREGKKKRGKRKKKRKEREEREKEREKEEREKEEREESDERRGRETFFGK